MADYEDLFDRLLNDDDVDDEISDGYMSPDLPVYPDNSSPSKECVVPTLSDLAAQVTGKHYTCNSLENHLPPLDETMIKKVAFWAFPQNEKLMKVYAKLSPDKENDWTLGEILARESQFLEIAQVGFMISAILSKPIDLTTKTMDSSTTTSMVEDAKVSLSFEKQSVTSATCSLCPQVVWCRHIIAVIIYRIHHADKIAVHGPVTDVLCTLDRNQIQKLLQYAILEDPGGIICRIFKNMDMIRDSRSQLNQTQGAPDPTFGDSSDQKSLTDMSMDKFHQDFKDCLQKVRALNSSYPDTCNLDVKAKSEVHHFLQRVVDLIESDDVDSAGHVLISMVKSTLNEINTQRHSKNVTRLFYDLDRLCTCFVASFSGQGRGDLVQAAIDINSVTQNMDNSEVFITASEWSGLESISLENCMSGTYMGGCHDNDSNGILGASREMPFYQTLCASLIPDAPDALGELFCGKQKPLTTSYEEKLPVMLLRFEALTQFEAKEREKKLFNLGVVILRKLLNLSLKYSVIGCNKVLESSNEESDESENEAVAKGTSRKRTYKQKTRPRKKPCSVPRLETTEVDMEGMSKAQVSYSLLFVCYTLYQIDNLVSLGREGISVIFDATFRALELGRFRAIAPQGAISVDGYRWLEFLDKKIQESYLKIADTNGALHTLQEQMIQKYTSALQEHQTSFYGDHYPLGLLSFLLKDSLVSDKVGQMLSFEAVCLSTCPLKNLTIPDGSYGSSHINDVKSRWMIVLKRVFSGYSGDEVNNNTVISKFLTFTESIDDLEYAILVYNVLREHQKEFILHEQRITCMRFLLMLIRLFNINNRTIVDLKYKLCTTLVEIGQQIQQDFFGLILPNWKDLVVFFNTDSLTEIIQVMEELMKEDAILPRETTDMILGYFEDPVKHDAECREFLNFFHSRQLRQEALQKVIINYENYTPTALLLLAKIEDTYIYKCNEMDPVPADAMFSECVFLLLQQALKRLRELNENSGEDSETPFTVDLRVHLLWFFEKIADCDKHGDHGNHQVTGLQLPIIMEDIAITIKNDSQLIISFFSKMEETDSLLAHAKQALGQCLIDIYKHKFQTRVQTCGRGSYQYVLQEMKEARAHCIQYVDSGSSLFKEQVTDTIRKRHRGKRRFLQLMDDKFPELRQ